MQLSEAAINQYQIRQVLLFVQHPDTVEALARDTSQKARKLIESMSGQINDVQEWGMRELAYPIAKQSRGIYVLIEYSATGDVVKELERTLIDDARSRNG